MIADYTADRAKLVVKGTEAQVARRTQLSEAAQKLRNRIQSYGNQRRTFVAMQDEVRSMRATGAPEILRQAQARHANSGMDAKQWDDFLLIYKGDVDKNLTAYIAWADREAAQLNGVLPPPGAPNVAAIAVAAIREFDLIKLGSSFWADRVRRKLGLKCDSDGETPKS